MDSVNPTPKPTEAFSNSQLLTEQWPDIEAVQYAPISKKYLRLLLVQQGLVGLTIGLIGLGSYWICDQVDELAWWYDHYLWLLVLLGLWLPYVGLMVLSFKKKGYALREHDLLYREGVLVTDITIIPYNRIQHLATHRGLLSRWMGLTTFKVFTAGHEGGDLSIPGLLPETAERMKALALQYIRTETGIALSESTTNDANADGL